jgi:hypothetical protein
MAAGTTGVPVCRARTAKPFWIFCSWPVREMLPSGKRHTSSPAASALIARRIPAVGRRDEIGITPASRKMTLKYQGLSASS